MLIASTRNKDKEKLLLDSGASYVLIDDRNLKDKVRAIFPNGVGKILVLVGTATLKDYSVFKIREMGLYDGHARGELVNPEFCPNEIYPGKGPFDGVR